MKPHTVSKLYLVVGESGDCDETHNQWNVAAYAELRDAEWHACQAKREIDTLYAQYGWKIPSNLGVWDPSSFISFDHGLPTYRVQEVPLNHLIES